LKGTVKRWLLGRGYGFIKPDEGEDDVFVHHSEIEGVFELKEGQRVEFEVEDTYKGPRAVKVSLVE
jgi:CspA family cold shock protein